jgi:hypothetical protein
MACNTTAYGPNLKEAIKRAYNKVRASLSDGTQPGKWTEAAPIRLEVFANHESV